MNDGYDDLLNDGDDGEEPASKKKSSQSKKLATPPTYEFTDERGLVCERAGHEVWLANFKPSLLEEQRVVDADGEKTGASTFIFRCTLPLKPTELIAESMDITLESKHFERDKSLLIALRAQLTGDYHIDPEGIQRFWDAGHLMRSGDNVTKKYATTGWVEAHAGWSFILPGAAGAITADGINEGVIHHRPDGKFGEVYNLYGKGMQPVETDEQRVLAEGALKAVFNLLPPNILVPIVSLILGAPLTSLGARSSPPLIHIFGKSGQGKTGSTTVLMGLFGPFGEQDKTESWTSTGNALQKTLHDYRDLPVLFDDYKLAHIKQVELGRVVQNYGDGTARSRLGAGAGGQERTTTYTPQALLLSTGEDRWEQEESVQARVLSLPFPYLEQKSENLDDRIAAITALRSKSSCGDLALVGGTYLRYLARNLNKLGKIGFSKGIEEIYTQELEKIHLPVHKRVRGTTAILHTFEEIIHRFLKAEFPSIANNWRQLCITSWDAQKDWLIKEAEEAHDLSSAHQLLDAIRNGLASEKVRLRRRRSAYCYGGTFGEIVGYFDDEFIYITDKTTYAWYRSWLGKQRADVLSSWSMIQRDAKEEFNGERCRMWDSDLHGIHATRIPHEQVGLIPNPLADHALEPF